MEIIYLREHHPRSSHNRSRPRDTEISGPQGNHNGEGDDDYWNNDEDYF